MQKKGTRSPKFDLDAGSAATKQPAICSHVACVMTAEFTARNLMHLASGKRWLQQSSALHCV